MLTGRTRYRVGWRKKLILQVEFWYLPRQTYAVYEKKPHKLAWCDATVEHMQAIERGEVQTEKPADKPYWDVPPCPQWWKDAGAKRRRDELLKEAAE